MTGIIKTKPLGFTLLEVLLGMSIMSIMMLLLFASLRICVQNWNAGEKKIAQISEASVVHNFLQSKLKAAQPLDADFFEEPQFSFQGDRDKMQFVAAMPASAGRLGLQLFNLSVKRTPREEGKQLMVAIQPFFPIDELASGSIEPVVVLKKIQRLKFAYFGLDSDDERTKSDPVWQDEWLERKRLPKLISVDIELTSGEVWPQLVLALKVDQAHAGGSKQGRDFFGISDGKFIR